MILTDVEIPLSLYKESIIIYNVREALQIIEIPCGHKFFFAFVIF